MGVVLELAHGFNVCCTVVHGALLRFDHRFGFAVDRTQSGHNNDRNSVFVRFCQSLSVAAKDLLRRSFVYVSCPQSLLWDNPLKAEITSSNLVRATMNCKAGCFGGLPFLLRRQEARRVGGKSCKAVPDSGHLFLVAALGTTFCVGFIGL